MTTDSRHNDNPVTLVEGGDGPAMERPSVRERAYGVLAKSGIRSLERMRETRPDLHRNLYDRGDFAWVDEVLGSTRIIKEELAALLQRADALPNFSAIDNREKRVENDTDWKIFMFFLFHHKFTKNCARCPETSRILERIPGLVTALFSVLQPGSDIAYHHGEFDGLVRVHVPLLVPGGGPCGLQVGEEKLEWSERDIIIFNHVAGHAAWNHGDEVRVVLLFDVVKPLPFPWSVINRGTLATMRRTQYIKAAIERAERSHLAADTEMVARLL